MAKLIFTLTLILFFISNTNIIAQSEQNYKTVNYKTTAEKIVREALVNKNGYNWLKEFTEIGPRLSGSENSIKAIHWAENKMKALGFNNVRLQPVMVPHWIRGKSEEVTIISPGEINEKTLSALALGGSIGTQEDGITANVIMLNDINELDSFKDKLKGKIVYFDSPLDEGLLSTFQGYGRAVGKRVFGAIDAAKYGAVGVMIRSITTRYDNVPHTGVMLYNDTIPKIPGVALGYQDSDYLKNLLQKYPDLKINMKLNCKTLPDAKSYNLFGELTGTEKPEEIILVGGHSDSWDVGVGAHDDGAGCIQSIEALNLLKELGIKPKRTIRCVLFINEENGSMGSKEYAKYADSSGENHIAAIESDAGGFNPREFDVSSDSATLEKIQSWIPILKSANILAVEKGGSGADISRIKNAKALIGLRVEQQRYFDLHHSPNDVFKEINARELELGSSAIAILAYLLSEEGL